MVHFRAIGRASTEPRFLHTSVNVWTLLKYARPAAVWADQENQFCIGNNYFGIHQPPTHIMFAKPRQKKPLLPPPNKKRKTTSAVEEVNFDFDARHEYLTGFHKRKQQRIKNAQEEAAKRERQEKLETRRQVGS